MQFSITIYKKDNDKVIEQVYSQVVPADGFDIHAVIMAVNGIGLLGLPISMPPIPDDEPTGGVN